jgi:hypothetical protein
MKAAAVRPAQRGLFGLVMLGAIAAIIPLFFRFSVVGIVLEIMLLIAAVTWLYSGIWPMFRIAKRFARELRDAGIIVNHDPQLDDVARFREWLVQNDLSVDQIAAICDRPSPPCGSARST